MGRLINSLNRDTELDADSKLPKFHWQLGYHFALLTAETFQETVTISSECRDGREATF